MGKTPSTACCASGFKANGLEFGVLQQRVLLFGSVSCDDLDSSANRLQNNFGNTIETLDQGFRHGRAQMFRQYQKQQHQEQQQRLEKKSQKRFQRNSYQDGYASGSYYSSSHNLDNSNNYFIRLGGGASSQTSDGRSFGRRDFETHQALFGEGLYDETS